MLYMDEWMRKYFYKEAIRGKQDKVKAFLFTSWQDYKNKWKRTQDPNNCFRIQRNDIAILQNGLDDINRSNIYLRDASEILYQKFSWWLWHYYFLFYELLQNHPITYEWIKFTKYDIYDNFWYKIKC